MTVSRSSAFSIIVLLNFKIRDLNEALYLNATIFSALSFSFALSVKISIASFTTIQGKPLASSLCDSDHMIKNRKTKRHH